MAKQQIPKLAVFSDKKLTAKQKLNLSKAMGNDFKVEYKDVNEFLAYIDKRIERNREFMVVEHDLNHIALINAYCDGLQQVKLLIKEPFAEKNSKKK